MRSTRTPDLRAGLARRIPGSGRGARLSVRREAPFLERLERERLRPGPGTGLRERPRRPGRGRAISPPRRVLAVAAGVCGRPGYGDVRHVRSGAGPRALRSRAAPGGPPLRIREQPAPIRAPRPSTPRVGRATGGEARMVRTGHGRVP